MPATWNDSLSVARQSRVVLTVYSGITDSGSPVSRLSLSSIQVRLVFQSRVGVSSMKKLPSIPSTRASPAFSHWVTRRPLLMV
ncbi:hypothetical protein D3C81_1940600 [compost metagenome]